MALTKGVAPCATGGCPSAVVGCAVSGCKGSKTVSGSYTSHQGHEQLTKCLPFSGKSCFSLIRIL